ncbi:MAG: TraR/DksA family transcriptional regulator [Myxococcales bacterium]
MDRKTLAKLREDLQRRRRDINDNRAAAERGVQEIREGRTDPEYEEGAQANHAEYTLGQLSDAHRRELLQIDAALARMDAGNYGICLDCELDIPPERLKALPFALRCADCATRLERETNRHEPATL